MTSPDNMEVALPTDGKMSGKIGGVASALDGKLAAIVKVKAVLSVNRKLSVAGRCVVLAVDVETPSPAGSAWSDGLTF